MHLNRTWTSAKLALATAAVAAMAMLLPAGTANAAPAATAKPEKISYTITRSAELPGATKTRLAATPLTIIVTNQTTTTFDAVNLGWFRKSAPGLQVATQGPFTPGALFFFQVPNCTDVANYAVHIVKGGVIVARTGDIVPDDTDGDLCSDVFDVG